MGGSSGSSSSSAAMDSAISMYSDWAGEDRARWEEMFRPIEDQYVADSIGYDTPERRAAEAQKAAASVQVASATARGVNQRNLASMGVNPASGRSLASGQRDTMNEALATVGAKNAAEAAVMNEGRARTGQAIGLGQPLLGQASQSLGASANIANSQLQNEAEASASLWGGIGSAAGMAFSMFSSEDGKTNKRRARGALRAVEKMRVDNWDYKPGVGDEGSHIGTYAEDFKRETGLGDGKKINVIDAIGTSMGAIKELSAKVDVLARHVRGAVPAGNTSRSGARGAQQAA